MEKSKENQVLPSLIKAITANKVAGFDSVDEQDDLNSRQPKLTRFHPLRIDVSVSHIFSASHRT